MSLSDLFSNNLSDFLFSKYVDCDYGMITTINENRGELAAILLGFDYSITAITLENEKRGYLVFDYKQTGTLKTNLNKLANHYNEKAIYDINFRIKSDSYHDYDDTLLKYHTWHIKILKDKSKEFNTMEDRLYFCKVRDVKSPQKAHYCDAGFDFFIPNDFGKRILPPGSDILIPSGIKVDVPEGYALIAMNKSGVATKQKLRTGAAVVDQNYSGEVHIHLFNDGTYDVILDGGMKIVQFVLVRIGNHQAFEISQDEYEERMKSSDRGEGGFGSTGVN